MQIPATVKAFPDLSGLAPSDSAWIAYDTNTYDGAPDAGRQVVGCGATPEEAIADWAEQTEVNAINARCNQIIQRRYTAYGLRPIAEERMRCWDDARAELDAEAADRS